MSKEEFKSNQNMNETSDYSGMGGSVQKAKDTKRTVKKLIAYSKQYILIILIAIIAAISGTIIALNAPGKLRDLTNIIAAGLGTKIDMPAVLEIVVTLILLYVASALLNALQGWIMATVTQKISKRLREDISKKINVLPMWFYNKNTTGDILSRITNM